MSHTTLGDSGRSWR